MLPSVHVHLLFFTIPAVVCSRRVLFPESFFCTFPFQILVGGRPCESTLWLGFVDATSNPENGARLMKMTCTTPHGTGRASVSISVGGQLADHSGGSGTGSTAFDMQYAVRLTNIAVITMR